MSAPHPTFTEQQLQAALDSKYRNQSPISTLWHLFAGRHAQLAVVAVLFVIKQSPVWVLPIITGSIVNTVTEVYSSHQAGLHGGGDEPVAERQRPERHDQLDRTERRRDGCGAQPEARQRAPAAVVPRRQQERDAHRRHRETAQHRERPGLGRRARPHRLAEDRAAEKEGRRNRRRGAKQRQRGRRILGRRPSTSAKATVDKSILAKATVDRVRPPLCHQGAHFGFGVAAVFQLIT
jgi:hypothetical protein